MRRLVILTMVLAIAGMLFIACGGGGGGGRLSTGGFIKTVAPATGNDWVAPFYTETYYQQHLYFASDINGSGYIESFSLRYLGDEPSSTNCSDVSIKMGHTSLSALTTTFANNVEQGSGSFEPVFSGSVSIPAGSDGDYFTIPLDTPFPYNGVDNLVVGIDVTTACDNVLTVDSTSTVYTDVSLWNDTGAATGTLYNHYLNTKFNFEGGDNALVYGGTTYNYWPFSDELPKIQTLHMASDIDGSGFITGLGFQLEDISTEQTYTYSVKMGHTTLAALGTTFDDNYNAGAPITLADAATFTVPAGIPAGEWFWVPLPDNTFKYNGTDNLIVEIEVTAGSGNTYLLVDNLTAGRRAAGYAGDDVAIAADSTGYHLKLRFNGGPMDVITDGGSGYIVPVAGWTEFIEQILYDNTSLGTGGQITELAFRLNLDSTAFDHTDVNLVLGHTTLSSLGGASFTANIESDRTEVFSGTISIPAGLEAGDWVTVPLTTPFDYDSTKNLVVQWDAPTFATTNTSRGHSYASGRYSGHVDANLGNRTSDTPSVSEDFILDMRLTVEK